MSELRVALLVQVKEFAQVEARYDFGATSGLNAARGYQHTQPHFEACLQNLHIQAGHFGKSSTFPDILAA